jgi:histidine triad (HIT) family protein
MRDPECIFCKIIAGEIPCAKVFESERILSFLDIAPVNKGHALVIPKDHHPTIFDIPAELAAEMLEAKQRIGRAVMDATSAPGLNVMMNNDKTAGQLVPHAHWHLIPRFEGDGLKFWPQHSYESNDEMASLADAVAARLG